MADTPRSYAAFRGAGCDRAVGQTDLRLIEAVQIIEPISRAPYRGARKRSKPGPQSDAYSTDLLGPAGREIPTDATTISETNPLMINKDIRQPLDPRASRGQLVRWIFMSLLQCMRDVEGGEKDIVQGEMARGFIVIAPICFTRTFLSIGIVPQLCTANHED